MGHADKTAIEVPKVRPRMAQAQPYEASEGLPELQLAVLGYRPKGKAVSTYGDGSLALRGRIWWMTYYVDGKRIQKSSRSTEREDANRILKKELARSHDPSISRHVGGLVGGIQKGDDKCTIGSTSELIVALDLMNHGYSVYRSVSHTGPVDLVAISRRATLKVEVKTAYMGKNGGLHFAKPKPDMSDILAVVARGGKIHYFPPLPTVNSTKHLQDIYISKPGGVSDDTTH